jgi:hypothetical protein
VEKKGRHALQHLNPNILMKDLWKEELNKITYLQDHFKHIKQLDDRIISLRGKVEVHKTKTII